MSNSKGTPLSLSAPAGKAPLAVNQQTMVKSLNAQFLGGRPLTQLQATGGGGVTIPGTDRPINLSQTVVASTGTLPAGLYFISATALLTVVSGDTQGFCTIIDSADPSTPFNEGGASQTGTIQAAETAVALLPAGHVMEEECFTNGNNGSFADNAGIIAIRIVHEGQARHATVRTATPGTARPDA